MHYYLNQDLNRNLMLNSTTTENLGPVCYVRVEPYFHGYLKAQYGGFPLLFPEFHVVPSILESRIAVNTTLKQVTDLCYSQAAFEYDREGKVFDIHIGTPHPDRVEEYVPIQLPETVQRHNGIVKVGKTSQLNKNGASLIRKAIKDEFWTAMSKFIDECIVRSRVTGDYVTIENAISDFMMIYDIPMEELDNMVKSERRKRKAMYDESKARRARIEAVTGNKFYYT